MQICVDLQIALNGASISPKIYGFTSYGKKCLRQKMFTAMIPDSENGIVRRVGSASDRRNDAISDVDIDDVDVIDVDGDDGDVESDVDEGRLVAQVTAVNVLSQVQKMQDEIQELNKQIEEENMKVKIKDLKKTMKLTPEGDCHLFQVPVGLEDGPLVGELGRLWLDI